jgi:hypothetical protein
VWRAQIILHTANTSHANTDDSVHVGLNAGSTAVVPSGNGTWLDYGRDDFEGGDTFAYDLDLHNIHERSDVTQIYISKTGSDGWCIADYPQC